MPYDVKDLIKASVNNVLFMWWTRLNTVQQTVELPVIWDDDDMALMFVTVVFFGSLLTHPGRYFTIENRINAQNNNSSSDVVALTMNIICVHLFLASLLFEDGTWPARGPSFPQHHCIRFRLYYNINTAQKAFNPLPTDLFELLEAEWRIYSSATQDIIGSDNGMSPGRCQAIIWSNAGIMSIGPLGTNFSEIFIEIYTFILMEMHLKMSSVFAGHISTRLVFG